jgi:hypothetical protein
VRGVNGARLRVGANGAALVKSIGQGGVFVEWNEMD